jgi:hypothetical protein
MLGFVLASKLSTPRVKLNSSVFNNMNCNSTCGIDTEALNASEREGLPCS